MEANSENFFAIGIEVVGSNPTPGQLIVKPFLKSGITNLIIFHIIFTRGTLEPFGDYDVVGIA